MVEVELQAREAEHVAEHGPVKVLVENGQQLKEPKIIPVRKTMIMV